MKVIFFIIFVQFCSIKNILFAYVTMYNDYIIRLVISNVIICVCYYVGPIPTVLYTVI